MKIFKEANKLLKTTLMSLVTIIAFGTISEISSVKIVANANSVNPIHHHTGLNDGSDYTEWSYVYFGSYPQSEVTDGRIIASVDSELSKVGKITGDVWVDGIKYRKIQKSDCNDKDKYHFILGGKDYRYFKWERIKWRILKYDGEKYLLLADSGLDCEEFNEEQTSVTWETSSIRKWLNGYSGYKDLKRENSFAAKDFYNTAFSNKEKNSIKNEIGDNVFLLTVEDVINESYGFCGDVTLLSKSRWIKASEYAFCVGAAKNGSETWYKNGTWWWLRSQGSLNTQAAGIDANGIIVQDTVSVSSYDDAVVPALYLKIISDSWSVTDDGTSGFGGENEPLNISLNKSTMVLENRKSEKLVAKIVPGDYGKEDVITWKTSNDNVATVTDGMVNAVGVGNAVITASLPNGNKAECAVNVTENAEDKLLQTINVSLNNHSIILSKNTTAFLSATITPKDLSGMVTLSWFSTDDTVATVSNGTVKAVGIGTADIIAGLSNGKSDRCKVTVTNGMVTPTPSYTTEEKQSTRDVQKGQMIADQASNGNYVITSDTSESPTAEYIGAIDGTKNSIKIPQSVYYQGLWYEVTSIKIGALKGNKNIKNVTIGKSVTKIGDNAFAGCVKLKKVTIGAGLQTIGKNAFKGCKSLTKLTLKTAKLKKVGGSALKGIYAKCKIKVPKAKLKEYQQLFKKKGQKPTVKISK